MPTNIIQTRDARSGVTTLKVDGEMLYDDAVLLEKIAVCMRDETGDDVTIDLADLDLIDSDAASIIRRMGDEAGFAIEGMEIFRQTIVNNAERSDP
jgi:anti-anti-sigma regulatory factor